MKPHKKSVFTMLLAISLFGGCSSSDDRANNDANSSEPAPEPVVDMGAEEDMPEPVLGELCHVKVGVTTDTPAAAPGLQAFDVTANQNLPILDRSDSSNFYFDAPLGHEVEITITASAGAPVAPYTYRATVDQRCASLGDLQFYTPVGLTLEQLDDVNIGSSELPRPFADVAAGLLFVRGSQAWHAIETTDNGRFSVAEAQADEAFATLPSAARFTSLSTRYILAAGADEVVVLTSSPGRLVSLGVETVATPLREVQVVDETLAIVHAADGGVWELTLGLEAQPAASWQRVGEAVRSMAANEEAVWLLDEAGNVSRKAHDATTPEAVGALNGVSRIVVNGAGTRLLGLSGDACEPWGDGCEAALLDAGDLTPIEASGSPVTATNVRAATRVGNGFVLATEEVDGVTVLHIEDDLLIEGESLVGSIAASRSAILPGALAIGTSLRTTFAREADASPAFEEGRWTVIPRTDEFVELVEEPCDELACERVLWFKDWRSRITPPGSALTLGAERDISPEDSSDAYQTVNFVRGDERAPTLYSITMEQLVVPSGSPCLPVIDTTVAVERFTPAAKALHCITWWE